MNEQLVIESIDKQFIPIDLKDYELEIHISGNPDTAVADGNMEAFYQDWDVSNGILRIKSEEVLRLIVDAIWIIAATKTVTQSGMEVSLTTTSDILYDVVLNTPVIEDPGNQIIYKGTLFYKDINIANRPALSIVDGLIIGLIYNPLEAGVNIGGISPKDANIAQSSFNARVYTENDAGSDELDVMFNISDEEPVYLFSDGFNDISRIDPNGELNWRVDSLPSDSYNNIQVTRDGVYILNTSTDTLHKFNIYDGTPAWEFSMQGGSADIFPTKDAVYIFHRATGIRDIISLDSFSGEEIWRLSDLYTIGLSPHTNVFANDHIYIRLNNQNTNTQNAILAVSLINQEVSWSYTNLLTGLYREIQTDETGVYIFDRSRDDIIKISNEGVLLWTASYGSENISIEITNNKVYVFETRGSQSDSRLEQLNRDTGIIEWTYMEFTLGSLLGTSPSGVYIQRGNSFYKINLSGTLEWTTSISGSNLRLVTLGNNSIYYAQGEVVVGKIDGSDGSVIWTSTPSEALLGTLSYNFDLLIEDEYIYLLIDSNHSIYSDRILRIRDSDGSEDWEHILPSSQETRTYDKLAVVGSILY